jgi:hypothetical protein
MMVLGCVLVVVALGGIVFAKPLAARLLARVGRRQAGRRRLRRWLHGLIER